MEDWNQWRPKDRGLQASDCDWLYWFDPVRYAQWEREVINSPEQQAPAPSDRQPKP